MKFRRASTRFERIFSTGEFLFDYGKLHSGAKHARSRWKEEEEEGNFSISLFRSRTIEKGKPLLHIHSCALIEKLFYPGDFVSRTKRHVRNVFRERCLSNFSNCQTFTSASPPLLLRSVRSVSVNLGRRVPGTWLKTSAIIVRMRTIICKWIITRSFVYLPRADASENDATPRGKRVLSVFFFFSLSLTPYTRAFAHCTLGYLHTFVPFSVRYTVIMNAHSSRLITVVRG